MKQTSIFSFFSGAGFLDLGFEKAGFDVVFVNELSSQFLNAYKYSREKLGQSIPKYGYSNESILNCFEGSKYEELKKNIRAERKEKKLVGFIGGPPCPDFSIGGKNEGAGGNNGKLSKSYVDLIVKLRPDFFVFENVKGLWRTQKHRVFFEELKLNLHNAGYFMTNKLVNALEFGVPQDRERIILFGIHKSALPPKFSQEDMDKLFEWEKHAKFNSKDFLRHGGTKIRGIKGTCANLPKELTVFHWFEKNDVTKHPNAVNRFVPRAGLSKFERLEEGDDSKKSYKRLRRDMYSPTAAYGNNEVHIHPTEHRRISAAEALAIQSLPKEFELPQEMTLTDMFKTIGNGVPFLAANGIAYTISSFLRKVSLCK